MESYELNACVDRLNRLKKDVQYRQKKGLPFILASVIIWALILLSRIAAADLRTANLMTFICCCLLIPLATLFSKLLKADIFRKTGNPLNGLVVLATLNQLLYLLIDIRAVRNGKSSVRGLYRKLIAALQHIMDFLQCSVRYLDHGYAVLCVLCSLCQSPDLLAHLFRN